MSILGSWLLRGRNKAVNKIPKLMKLRKEQSKLRNNLLRDNDICKKRVLKIAVKNALIGVAFLRTHYRIAEQQYSGQMRCLGWIVF